MSTRPHKLIGIAGTGTEVGKTWVATRFIEFTRTQGYSVAARKPAQSFAADDTTLNDAEQNDAEQLAHASGETAMQVCPLHRWYPLAMAPPMAADALARPRITLTDLLAEIQWPPHTDVGIVETAGGLCSPIAHDADNVELLRTLNPDHIVLVADAGLGTINAVRLCVAALAEFAVTVFLNRYDANNSLHLRNRQWLSKHYEIDTAINIEACWARVGK
jgi:dethiobiotin synthetase